MRSWGRHGPLLSSPQSSPTLDRSISANNLRSESPARKIWKAKSTNALRQMASTEMPARPVTHDTDASEMNTLPDPRSASSSNLSETGSSSSRHPDLSNEVAALSDKLINAINYQTTLDDTLAQTKHELEASRARIQQLETESRLHEENILSGQLVAKAEVDDRQSKLTADLADERRQRSLVQQEKRGIETELETLTASLFEEANNMVASANIERDAVEKRNQQLRDQVKDTEQLLASQHEQLTELKTVMQHMSLEGNKESTGSPLPTTAPTSPTLNREENNITRLLEAMNLSPNSPLTGEISPAPSTSFTHLLKAVCRTDLPAYEDFRSLLSVSKQSHSQPASRVASASYSGLNVVGLSSLANGNQPKHGASASMSATPNLNNSPNLPGSFSPNSAEVRGPVPLKETRFFKRLLVEDVEPALRLDLSPTISWLSRRTIIAALIEGSMIVEPIPESHRKLYGRYTSCAMCGEARKSDENPRTHRMRVNEGEGATKWPLCIICLEKVRGVGDLVSYVRMIRDGVVKCHETEEELEAWDELVRLRERLFWARMAGGVVPAFLPSQKSSPVVPDRVQSDKGAGEDRVGKLNGLQGPAAVPDSPLTAMVRHDSGSSSGGNDTQDEVDEQLERSLRELNAANAANEASATTLSSASASSSGRPQTPSTPSKRESGGFLKVNIPGTFWGNSVNVLH